MIYNIAGGGAGLDLRVKNYATSEELLAAAPAENTLGIVAASMSGWFVGPKAPDKTENGCWIRTGTDGAVALTADPLGHLTVYPVKAYTTDGTSWTATDLYIYTGGAWTRPWVVYMQDGVAVTSLTLKGAAAIDANGLNLSTTGSSSTNNAAYAKLDVTNYSTVTATVNTNILTSHTAFTAKLGITGTANNASTWIASTDMKAASAGTYTFTVDISAYSGEVYVQALVKDTGGSTTRRCYITDWRVEP